ncbi:putative flavo protein [Hesseltinella vesiculosa]|uniref:Putative flavo protein n=1 Tax=Hesseltinella vesiculosa TaxID=101127 RepID=A0A1X2GCN2_9FUNG|nr:putative flavo protein [Hesseltinella vesiculosa]
MSKPSVGIIGAGFSGMIAAIQVRTQLGITPKVFDYLPDVGGTWLANQYSGCACDIPSGLYNFSFALNPEWSTTYSPQPEIYDYMRSVARQHKMYDYTLFNTEVLSVNWLEESKHYCGIGPLRIPHIPEEFKSFTGTTIHTAVWNPSMDFKDKIVAVIGNGASAVQAIPCLQTKAKHLYSYQRSATWVAPRYQYKYPGFIKLLFRWFPILLRLQRYVLFLIHEATFPLFKNSRSLLARFVRWWFKVDMRLRLARRGRTDLVPVLTPDYAVGCKRIARSENYLEALASPNVTVKMGKITKVQGQTIYHEDGSETHADVLVLASGFEVKGCLGNLKVHGRNGVELNSLWSKNDYPSTFKTVAIHNFPNFFLLLGPNSGLGHNSVLLMIEIQVKYTLDAIKYMIKNKLKALEPKLEHQNAFSQRMVKDMQGTTWLNGGCTSYYKANGAVFALWPSSVISFWMELGFNKKHFVQHV